MDEWRERERDRDGYMDIFATRMQPYAIVEVSKAFASNTGA